MKVAVTGANGQLGTDLCQSLQDFDVVPLTHADIDIADMASIRKAMLRHKPAVIINTAAYVLVDDSEDEPDKAFSVNALGARNLAMTAQELGAKLVYVSTDYVFGGEGHPRTAPYTESDIPAPVNTYGESMLAGENFVRSLCQKHFVIRTSGLFGVVGSRAKGGNFVETALKLAAERNELRVVDDQVLSPTYTRDLARKIAQLISTEYYGLFHITNTGACSWYEFTVEILRLAGIATPVVPITSDQYPRKARRPHYSVLDNSRLRLLGMDDMRPWQEALRDYLKERRR